ncbi:heterokaryon incompatibility protein [Pyrenophora tritici-repentis]|nr:heterokaryon incompatibility protein [Pyrenophora tritici-repentis]KAI1538512.1 heterokaryon incompatibility protein [Pyrenophora tritici-repentis]KAI1550146.1 heterokaryon incompatibility protein [Pyrenophora tritici-repentis]KAI1569678.1 heterokaryon incompatibility protein [Pyrenophora tritici-repentis]KAI1589808.1 heterokaryon incompatibility protein [Pyrenophora tritici-repentis]
MSSASFEEHNDGIDVEKLQKTYQDTIVVARKLDLRYLWIDKLCISQEDAAEWPRDSPRFTSVYSNTYIVLAATGSGTDNDGLSIFNATRSIIHAFRGSREDFTMSRPSDLLEPEPLSQHAWAFKNTYSPHES